MRFIFASLLLLFSLGCFAQQSIPPHKDVKALLSEATELMHNGENEKSLIKCRNALRYSLQIKDYALVANCYNTIAANFDNLSEPEKALSYYKKGLIYAEKTSNNTLKNYLYNNLGNIYCFDKNEYEKGIGYYKKSLEYSSKIHDSTQITFTNLNITWAYFDINQFEKGKPYLDFINKHHPKHGENSTLATLNLLNGMYYNFANQNDSAQISFEKAIRIGKTQIDKSDLSYAYEEYSKFLSKIGEYSAAYDNLTKYNAIREELNNEDRLRKVHVAGINLEIDEYKREIDKIGTLYKTRQQQLESEQSRNKKIIIIIISLFIISIILFYFFYQNSKLKQKNKLKDIQSKIQDNIINANIDGQEKERKEIAAFLHDNISALLSSAGMHLKVLTSNNDNSSDEIVKTKAILEEAHDKVRHLSHELLPTLLVRFGLFYAIEDLCEKNSNSNIHFEYISAVPTNTRYNEKFEMRIYFVVSELLNNITKHSNATKAQISVAIDYHDLIIGIHDNGHGFDTRTLNQVEGYGLNRIRSRIKNLKGEFKVKSKVNYGTYIRIKVPVLY